MGNPAFSLSEWGLANQFDILTPLAGAEAGSCGARASMVHHRRHPGEQPVVRYSVDDVDIVGWVLRAEPTPACRDHRSLPGTTDSLEHDLRDLLGTASEHAPETDVHGRGVAVDELGERGRRAPALIAVVEPVAVTTTSSGQSGGGGRRAR
jgi:hypothetical protein